MALLTTSGISTPKITPTACPLLCGHSVYLRSREMSEIKVERVARDDVGDWKVYFSRPVRLDAVNEPDTYWWMELEDGNGGWYCDTAHLDALAAFKWGQWVISMQEEWEKEHA
jgi:hypothetical protein